MFSKNARMDHDLEYDLPIAPGDGLHLGLRTPLGLAYAADQERRFARVPYEPSDMPERLPDLRTVKAVTAALGDKHQLEEMCSCDASVALCDCAHKYRFIVLMGYIAAKERHRRYEAEIVDKINKLESELSDPSYNRVFDETRAYLYAPGVGNYDPQGRRDEAGVAMVAYLAEQREARLLEQGALPSPTRTKPLPPVPDAFVETVPGASVFGKDKVGVAALHRQLGAPDERPPFTVRPREEGLPAYSAADPEPEATHLLQQRLAGELEQGKF